MAGLLVDASYDPAVAVAVPTSGLQAMTALDTAHLRGNFVAPANGCVLVNLSGLTTGATTYPRILLGLVNPAATTATGVNALNSATVNVGSTSGFPIIGSFVLGGTVVTYTGITSTSFTGCSNHAATTGGEAITGGVICRLSPMGQTLQNAAGAFMMQEAACVIPNLTPGDTYNFDAALGVEVVVASTNLKFGGPDDATGADAWGKFGYEIWDTVNLLGACLYDPAIAQTKATTALRAMTALDTTFLRMTFTTAASGPGSTSVWYRLRTQFHGSTTDGSHLLGVMDGATVRARRSPVKAAPQTGASSSCLACEATGVIKGLTPSTTYTFDAASGVQVVSGGGGFKQGGPDNATTNDAFGATGFEIWKA